jgi:uncharacterized OB-fold protein
VTDDEVLDAFPYAPMDRFNVEYYRRLLGHELAVARCQHCGRLQYPIMPVCPSCLERDMGFAGVVGDGTVYMRVWTQRQDSSVYTVPDRAVLLVDGWLTIGTIELDEQPGLRVSSLVLSDGTRRAEVGDRVSLLWLERGNAPFPAFRLAA